jgi:hypothetical protein
VGMDTMLIMQRGFRGDGMGGGGMAPPRSLILVFSNSVVTTE